MSSHSRASPMVMVLSQPQPQQVTARFSSFNQGSTLNTDISPPFSALLRIPSLIALSLSLILVFLSLTGYSLSEKTEKVKNYFHFFSLFFAGKSLTFGGPRAVTELSFDYKRSPERRAVFQAQHSRTYTVREIGLRLRLSSISTPHRTR